MPAFKHEDTSPVLFLNVKGEPMRFYVRPGPTKVQLQPLIASGGGVLCRTQEPSAVLLADPLELTVIAEGFGQFYVSTQYILDCVAQNQQLDIESYRFSNIQPVQTRMATRKRHSMGRMGYSLEDDMAILKYINKRKTDAKGNRVWKEMEQKRITSHSWQSMKDRYLKHLQYKQLFLSPKKGHKVTPVVESPTTDDCTAQSSGTKTGKRSSCRMTAMVASSDSDESDENTVDQPAPEPSEIRPSSQSSNSGENQPSHSENDGAQNPPSQSEQQLHERQNISEQPAASTKRARTETEVKATQGKSSDSSRKGRKSSKPSKRKIGILERAAREFEDSQTINDGSQDYSLHSQSSMGSDTDEAQISAARARAMRADDVGSESSEGEDQESLAGLPQSKMCPQGPEADDAGPSGAAPVMSNTHMFLFQQESQEDPSQSPEQDSNTEDLLEAHEHVVYLVEKSKKSLPEVLKALLKASGDTTLALSYLLKGYDPTVHGPRWTRRDDEIILSRDSSKFSLLDLKYGTEHVSRRIRFLLDN